MAMARSTQRAIFNYWKGRGVFPQIVFGECFACNFKTRELQRAHLIANCSGGSGEADNLVLLCHRCHRDAPMIGASKEPMANWIKNREPYLCWKLRRIAEEVNAIDGLAGMIVCAGHTPSEFTEKMETKIRSMDVGFHGGGDGIATLIAVVNEVYKDHCFSANAKQESLLG